MITLVRILLLVAGLSVVFLAIASIKLVVVFPLIKPGNDILHSGVLAEKRGDPKEVIGFLPYWNLSSLKNIPYDKLTTIFYFGIDVDGEGNFNLQDGGWNKLKSSDYADFSAKFAKFPQLRKGVTIVSLDASNIARLVNNPTSQDRLIANTVKLVKQENFQDINLDLEYAGDLNNQTIKDYTQFVKKLTEKMHQEFPGSRVSLDAYADSVAKKRIFDIPQIAKIVDQVIIMGYDFHRLGSTIAGPIAPLFGKEKYEYEVYQSVIDYLEYVPNKKLVLAVPFYGYEWPTENPNLDSFVIHSARSPEISSYKRSLETAKENNVTVNFDDLSKSAWFSYYDKNSKTFRQVWFENERSLGLKFDLVNQADLAGIGIWALGYDGEDNMLLWKTVAEKLR